MTRRTIGIVLIGLSTLQREGLAGILHSANFHIVASGTDIDKLQAASFESRRSLLLIVEPNDRDPGFLVRQIELFKANHPSGRVAVLGHNPQPEEPIAKLCWRGELLGFEG
jgi:two-component system, NarL family, nitrate/nitrite response regulator NarL